jgi:microcystin-dependent protein
MECFIGQLAQVAFNFAPQNWALCNGQLLPIRQYSALFSLLGVTYGGDGVNTFGLPDLQGRVAIHAGSGNGLTPYQLGQNGGAETVPIGVAEMPVHTHQIGVYSSTTQPPSQTNPSGNVIAGPTRTPAYATEAPNAFLAATAVTPQGGGLPHANIQPFLALNWIICLNGIFPSRP